MIYLDASAAVTLLSDRTPAAELEEYLQSRPGLPMATSSVGFVETVRTLGRMGSYPQVQERLERDFTEILVTEDVRRTASNFPGSVKALDALHIASAQTVGEHLVSLVTYDKQMHKVAAEIGLPVASPGMSLT